MTYDDQNVFAKILRGELPAYKVYEDEHTLAFMDVFPRTKGHCLVIPKVAARNVLDIDGDALSHLTNTLQKVAQAAKVAMKADGVTIEQNNEAAGGQVVFHLHFHIMPRYEGEKLDRCHSNMADGEMLALNAKEIAAQI